MAGTKVAAVALTNFLYAEDGFTVKRVAASDVFLVDDVRADGMAASGLIRIGADERQQEPPPAPVQAPPVEPVAIPADWRSMHHLKIIALAKSLGADISTKADAIAAIEAAEKA